MRRPIAQRCGTPTPLAAILPGRVHNSVHLGIVFCLNMYNAKVPTDDVRCISLCNLYTTTRFVVRFAISNKTRALLVHSQYKLLREIVTP